MAFIDIKDPIKREETVQDYIKNIKEIRARSENKKVHDISQRQDLAKVFQPVVQATEKSASQITNELKNLKEEPKHEAFKGTPALWRLIMYKTPEAYEPEDFENFIKD